MNIGNGKIIRSTVAIALSMSVGAIFGITATAHAKVTEAICHWDDSAGAWELEVLSPRAAEKHLENHELDGVPGGVVPGTLGAMFTESCGTCFDSNPYSANGVSSEPQFAAECVAYASCQYPAGCSNEEACYECLLFGGNVCNDCNDLLSENYSCSSVCSQ